VEALKIWTDGNLQQYSLSQKLWKQEIARIQLGGFFKPLMAQVFGGFPACLRQKFLKYGRIPAHFFLARRKIHSKIRHT